MADSWLENEKAKLRNKTIEILKGCIPEGYALDCGNTSVGEIKMFYCSDEEFDQLQKGVDPAIARLSLKLASFSFSSFGSKLGSLEKFSSEDLNKIVKLLLTLNGNVAIIAGLKVYIK